MKRILQFLVISVFLNACSREWDNSLENKFPDVITLDASEISFYTVILSGNVLNEGGSSVIESGICYSTSQNPTIENNIIILASGSGVFSGTVSGLENNTKYFVRAYAINDNGTSYGNQISFTTLSILQIEGLIAYYPFNGNANDESGNNNHGTIYGALLCNDRFENIYKAYSFNGNNRIDVPDDPTLSLSSGQFTISSWVQLSAYSADGGYYLMGQSEGPGNTRKWIFFIANNGISFIMSGVGWISLGSFAFNLGQWYHVAVRRNGNYLSAFVNGISIGSSSVSISTPDVNAIFQIGTAESGHPNRLYRGNVDDIRIYNTALDDSEIIVLYQEGG